MQEGRPVGGCPPATSAMAAAGRWGKTERRPRGSHSRAHLGLLRTVEAAPRESRGAAAALGGGGAVVLGEEGRRRYEAVMVWCGEPGRPSAPFIGGERRFGKGIFSGEDNSGELGRLREGSAGSTCAGVWPGIRPIVEAWGSCGGR